MNEGRETRMGYEEGRLRLSWFDEGSERPMERVKSKGLRRVKDVG